ncbi:hypothetical protein ACFWNH_28930 [Rhodococcus qingshengii]|uniref:hypothetical protein n=1 Tax=Rhodococcus qingshengii TaxID=334542 RepID=UPI0036659A8A
MKISRLVRSPQDARDAAQFVVDHFVDESAASYFARPEFTEFMKHVATATWADAAKEYREITGADIKTSVIAAEVARRLH